MQQQNWCQDSDIVLDTIIRYPLTMPVADRGVGGETAGACLHAVDEVMAGARSSIRATVSTPELQQLLEKAISGLEQQIAEDKALLPFVHLPLAVYRAVRGEEAPAMPLAVATTLLFLGIDILDDIADGDLPPHWHGVSLSEVQLVAATLLSSLPQLAVSQMNILPVAKTRMIACLSEGLLKMSGGQLHDIRGAGKSTIRPEEVESSVVHKSGEEGALIAMLAAHMAGVSEETAQLYGEFGRALSTSGQIATDCYDLFQAAESKDFANGSRTLPIVLHLNRLSEKDRKIFLTQLDEARHKKSTRALIQRELRAKGVLRLSAIIVEVYCQKAREVLDKLALATPERADLDHMINHVSFFSKREGAWDR